MPTVKMYIGSAVQQSIIVDNTGIITVDSTTITVDDTTHTIDES